MDFDVKSVELAGDGVKKVEWAEREMKVLRLLTKRFAEERPLEGVKVAACLHVTSETANLMRTLKAGGATTRLCASNPLSTQDDVAAALATEYGVPTFAIRGEDRDTYYRHIDEAVAGGPDIALDDGCDLVSTLHGKYPQFADNLIASMEETTTGVIRLRAMASDGELRFPVFAVNDADTKHLFDNRYGTGQSTVDGILRATNVLFAGKNVVVAGYGWCGRGFASRARGMGAKVIVTEVDPLRALEAAMDGFGVMPMGEAAEIGDIFCTLTGDTTVISAEHMASMKDGAILCNSGHFNVEIDIEAMEKMSSKVERGVRPFLDRYELRDGRSLFLIGEGRLVNLAAAEGHPSCVMDMSFSVQALTAEYAVTNRGNLEKKVHDVPHEIDEWVAKLKLESMGVSIDKLTPEQEDYLASWQLGT